MKILFAIQGTGNGHISRAREIIPYLSAYGQLDLLISGTQADVSLPYLVRYKKTGLSFTFGKKGGIDMIDTIRKLRPIRLMRDILSFPVQEYDLVVNDFEPLSAWACVLKRKRCFALSHQASYLSDKSPRPSKKDPFAEGVLRHYAPCTDAIGFHFMEFDHFIHKPVIRGDVRKQEPVNKGHITVYLPAHDDTVIINRLGRIKDIKWEVYSKHSRGHYRVENVHIHPINNQEFTASLASSDGLLTAGGFEGPAEAIYLGKKVMSIPMFDQYEQLCNAEAMKKLGVTVVNQMGDDFVQRLKQWAYFTKALQIEYPDETERIVQKLVNSYKQEREELSGSGYAKGRGILKLA